jgi:hypothetical protein
VTVSEFLFLALGLVLGVASGVALIEIIRARPPARREVKLTVSQDAIPRRRPSTLADDAFVAVGPEPARGGPADRRGEEEPGPVPSPDRRTTVRSAEPVPARVVGMPISHGADPMLDALQSAGQPERTRALTAARAPGAKPRRGAAGGGAGGVGASVGLLDPPVEGRARASGSMGSGNPSSTATAQSYTGPCAEERRIADQRCELAGRARDQAVAAANALRAAQRAYDSHTAAAEEAALAADPRAVRTLKEDAQRAFRAASRAAGSPDAVEGAARTWLQDINRINREAAAASLTAERERELATAVGQRLERLTVAADAARVGADMAEAACVEARTAVAECDERAASGAVAPKAPPPPTGEPGPPEEHDHQALGAAIRGGGTPGIFRLLRGDAEIMDALVAQLAGDDADEQRRWELTLATLVDAIRADAIEQGYLRYPHEHVFWGPYTVQQNRDISRALASLGYRCDGLGGWVDDRVPSQRELSLALGYAGLDPMRMRVWPNEEQTAQLFREVEVAGDEYVAEVAGDLTLAEMIEMLGRRADSLVDLWNHWGKVRSLLLEEG